MPKLSKTYLAGVETKQLSPMMSVFAYGSNRIRTPVLGSKRTSNFFRKLWCKVSRSNPRPKFSPFGLLRQNINIVLPTTTLGPAPWGIPAHTHTCANIVLPSTIESNAPSDPIPILRQRPTPKLPLTKHRPPSTSNDSGIVSPINAQIFQHYLSGYHQNLSDFLINGFSFGFKIPYFGERKFRLSENLPSLKGKA